jgi:hypothetical protein
MMITDKDIRDIQAYNKGLLPPHREERFKERLLTEPDFKSKFDELNPMLNALEEINFENKIREIIAKKEFETVEIEEEIIVQKIIPFYRRVGVYVAAACVVVFVGAFVWESNNLSKITNSIEYQIDEGLGTNENTCPDSILLNLYRQKQYEKFVKLIEAQATTNCKNLYKGVSLLALNTNNKAIEILKPICLDSSDTFIQENAQWYLALAYLKTNDKNKGIEQLRNISKIKNHEYGQLANEMLAKLEQEIFFYNLRF